MKTFKEFYLSEQQLMGWKEYLENNPLFSDAIEIINKLDSDGKSNSLIVGGAVRDAIMGNPVNDVDIATNKPMEETEKIFQTHSIGKNKDFGVVVIQYKGNPFEIANYRKDSETYADGRHPDSVTLVDDFKEDAARRDFKLNSLGIDRNGNIIDHHGGIEDIKNKIISTVGDAQKRFSEDFLRMLRAIRFSARMGFKIDPKTMQAIKDNADKITGIAAERIFKEVFGMAKSSGEKFADAILSLKETGLLKHIIPELPEENLEAFVAPVRQSESRDPVVNLSILLHSLSVQQIEKLCARLKLDTDQKNTLIFVAKHHQKIHELLGMSQKEAMDIIGHKYFDVLMNVFFTKAKTGAVDEAEWKQITQRIETLKQKFSGENSIDNIKKIINGEWIMQTLGIKPGPQLGKIINSTLEWIINNDVDIKNLKQIEDHIKNAII